MTRTVDLRGSNLKEVSHYEPQVPKDLLFAVPLADMTGKISAHFGEAPYFALVRLRLAGGEIERQEVIANPHTAVTKAKGIRVAEWLVNQKVDVLAVKEDLHKKGPAYVFADAGVEVRVSVGCCRNPFSLGLKRFLTNQRLPPGDVKTRL